MNTFDNAHKLLRATDTLVFDREALIATGMLAALRDSIYENNWQILSQKTVDGGCLAFVRAEDTKLQIMASAVEGCIGVYATYELNQSYDIHVLRQAAEQIADTLWLVKVVPAGGKGFCVIVEIPMPASHLASSLGKCARSCITGALSFQNALEALSNS